MDLLATHQSVLDVLTDVLETFFKKFTLNLKAAVEDEENHGTTFPVGVITIIVY